MKREERERQLQELREAQMSLMDVMSASDAHASKCIKLGLNFRNEYPSEYDAYEKARESYNANEIRIAELENMQVDDLITEEDRHEDNLQQHHPIPRLQGDKPVRGVVRAQGMHDERE